MDAPRRHLRAKVTVSSCHLKEASMEQTITVGLDIAKQVFQAHGADAAGHVLFRKRLMRSKLLGFFAAQAPCVVAMEACAGSHHWGREISKLGHTVRLIPPAYVKPFVKRQKNDAADTEAICEAARRPSMRFVPVKNEQQQANGVVFRARDLLVHQRTQCTNALRGHLSEYGYIFSHGITHAPTLIAHVEDPNSSLPKSARAVLKLLIDTFSALEAQIKELDAEINRRLKVDPIARRLMTIPGVGPMAAHSDHSTCASGRELPNRARLRGLARADTAAESGHAAQTSWPRWNALRSPPFCTRDPKLAAVAYGMQPLPGGVDGP
jgi:hypothetical protein